MSDWRTLQQPASFRGVPFFVERGSRGGGRQTVTHDYPFDETPPFSEDLGKKGRSFRVEGHVVGDDYADKRDALADALEQKGPGTLVHPYYGTRTVAVDTFTIEESTDRGGIATFSISFVETSAKATQPSATLDATTAAGAAAAALSTAAGTQFLADFRAQVAFPAALVGSLQSASRALNTALGVGEITGQSLAAIRNQIDGLSGQAAALVATPSALLASLTSVFESVAGGLIGIADAAGMLGVYSFDPGVRPPDSTPNRAIEQVNFDALQHLVQRLALAQASVLLLAQTFTSYDDAVIARAAVVDLIDAHVELLSDDTFPFFVDLRSSLVAAVPGGSSALPHLERYTPPQTVPSLVLAHRLYGTENLAENEADVVARNRIANPGFVVGGAPLEVLSS